jgi:hypothetical protein
VRHLSHLNTLWGEGALVSLDLAVKTANSCHVVAVPDAWIGLARGTASRETPNQSCVRVHTQRRIVTQLPNCIIPRHRDQNRRVVSPTRAVHVSPVEPPAMHRLSSCNQPLKSDQNRLSVYPRPRCLACDLVQEQHRGKRYRTTDMAR